MRRAWWCDVASVAVASIAVAMAALLAYRALVAPDYPWVIALASVGATVALLVAAASRRARPGREAIAAYVDRVVGGGGRVTTLATVPDSPLTRVVEEECERLLPAAPRSCVGRSARRRFAIAGGAALLGALLFVVPSRARAEADPSAAERLAARAADALVAAGDPALARALRGAATGGADERAAAVETVLDRIDRSAAVARTLDDALDREPGGAAARGAIAAGRGDGAAETAAALAAASRRDDLPPDVTAALAALADATRRDDSAAFARAAADVRRATGGSAPALDAARSAARALAPSLPRARAPIPTAGAHAMDVAADARPVLREALRRYFEAIDAR